MAYRYEITGVKWTSKGERPATAVVTVKGLAYQPEQLAVDTVRERTGILPPYKVERLKDPDNENREARFSSSRGL